MKAIDAWIEHPPSESIAAELNKASAEVCEHRRDPCYLRCGVHRDVRGRWVMIPHDERVRWKREAFR